MSKEIWTLIIKTSLPETAESTVELALEVKAFGNFEDAKKALREKLKELAFTENAMFDSKGKLVFLDRYAEDLNDEYDDDEGSLSRSKLNCVQNALKGIFEGKDAPLQMKEVERCSDWMIAVDITQGGISIYGCDDGPFNGYDPKIKTNMFDMAEEKDYYLYIDDMLGQEEASSELYIDLVKTKLE